MLRTERLDLMKKGITEVLTKGKRIASDFILRISASVLTTFANQIVLLPLLALIFDADEYGLILTLFGIKNIISGTLGNSLYSTRLIVNSKYEEEQQKGDFNRLILISAIISIVVMGIASKIVGEVNTVIWVLLLPVVAIYTLNSYFIVWYPIKLEFKQSFIHSIVVSIGTLIGALIVYITHLWPLAYLASGIAGLLFITKRTEIIQEGLAKTKLKSATVRKWIMLMMTTLLTNIVTYLDRLILYPLIGAAAVSIFSTASYFGKALSVLIMPISSVMLGYYAQRNFKMTKKRFWSINGVCAVLLLIFAFFSLTFGKSVTGLLFPKLMDDAAPYIFIANMSSAIAALTQIVQATALKYAKTYWQIIIQIVYFTIYFGLGMVMIKTNGLMGFCFASLFANTSRMVILLVICHTALGVKDECKKD